MANMKHQLNEECVCIFRNGVERVLTNWTALKLAVEHGTGGPKSQELAANFVQYIGEILCEGGNIEPEEVSDILVEVMDTQFDTWCEDNSPEEVASVLCRLYHLCLQENLVALKQEVENLPMSTTKQSKEWRTEQMQCHTGQICVSGSSLASVPEIENEEHAMQDVRETFEEDPGWTQVKSRKKHVT